MSKSPKLMSELDRVAFLILKQHFPETPAENATSLDPEKQIKAFTAVVNYYGPRTKLGGDEETKGNEFNRLRDRLHGRRTPRGSARRAPAEGGADATPAAGANGSGEPST